MGFDRPTPFDLVDRRATDRGDRPAIVHGDRTLTYAQLATEARGLAAALRAADVERYAAAIACPISMLTHLVAASSAGIEVCAYPVDAPVDEVTALAARFDHEVIVTDRDDLDDAARAVLRAGDLAHTAAPPRGATGQAAPLLVLTSGTTDQPKAARHDWRRLVAAARRWRSPDSARWLLTYNLHQFAGLQVVLHVLVSGATLVVPAGNQPRQALAVLDAGDVTHASATPTFWRMLVGLLTDRPAMPPLDQVTLGGEAVPTDLPGKLRAAFPGARISQVYASTEFGSGAATDADDAGLPRSLLERGPDALVRFKVVDGELHALSGAGMLGYYGDPEVGDGWRRTGDLVEIDGDRLRFVGRAVEIVNVGGVKVHPLVVEERALTVPRCRAGARLGPSQSDHRPDRRLGGGRCRKSRSR